MNDTALHPARRLRAGRPARTPGSRRLPVELPRAKASPSYARLGSHQLLLVYDGGCGICTRLARHGSAIDLRHRVVWAPSQAPGLGVAADLTPDELHRSAWALDPAGGRWEGPLAMASVADHLVLGGLPLCRTMLSLPLIRPLSQRAYRLLADHRADLGSACGLAPTPDGLEPAVRWEIERRRDRWRWLEGEIGR